MRFSRVRHAPAVLGLACVLGACGNSTAVAPDATVTLLVENSTCTTEGCGAIRVLAFPNSSYNAPAGPWAIELGTVMTPTACLVIPASATAHITNAGTNATTTFTWTTNKGLALGSMKMTDNLFTKGSSTPEFVPRRSAGWRVSLPGTGVPVQSQACTP